MSKQNEIFTIGHSTHDRGDFTALLENAGVRLLVDVRRYPGSRRVPWTNGDVLGEYLSDHSIDFLHLPELGGRRRPAKGSENNAWRNAQFQGYADHMDSPEFAVGLDKLKTAARSSPAAVMCAETQWWRCHRRLLADALLVGGWRVFHIHSGGSQQEHSLTEFAAVEGDRLLYPACPPVSVQAT